MLKNRFALALGTVALVAFMGCGGGDNAPNFKPNTATVGNTGATGNSGSSGVTGSSGTSLGLQDITYTDIDGTTQTVVAFPGDVIVFAHDASSVSAITAELSAAGGSVTDQDTTGTILLASVPAGSESQVIASLIAGGHVDDAIPNQFFTIAGVGVGHAARAKALSGSTVGTNTGLYVLDDFAKPNNALLNAGWNALFNPCANEAHGNDVAAVASNGLNAGGAQVPVIPSAGNPAVFDVAKSMTTAAIDGARSGNRSVINMSMQGPTSDANGHELSASDLVNSQLNFLNALANVANKLDDATLANTVFVVSAGNGIGNHGQSGVDLNSSNQLGALQAKYPRLFNGTPHFVIVTGSGDPTNPCNTVDKGLNFASNPPPGVVSAPSRNVPIPGMNCNEEGTSFAAPAVSNTIASLLNNNPSAKLDDVLGPLLSGLNNQSLSGTCLLQGTWTGTDNITVQDANCSGSVITSGPVTMVFSSVSGANSGNFSGNASAFPTFSYSNCGPVSTGTTQVGFSGTFDTNGTHLIFQFGSAGNGSGSTDGKTMTITLNSTSTNGSPVLNQVTVTKQ
jgi:hypothetical protein